MIRVTVNNRGVQAIPLSPVTVGAEGIVAAFLFSDDWAGLAKTAIFKGSGEEVEKIVLNNECAVPPEVLAEAGGMLQVGVYGNDGHGTTIRPTVWGVVGRIEDGAISEDAGQTGTTPSWAAQVQNAVQEAITTANNAVIAAEENADDSEAWAVGTRDEEAIPETDPAYQNYAKYWAERAAASATEGAESATTASSKANEAAASASTASNKAGEAATSASNAATSAEAANTAKTAAQNAQTAAEQAKAGAETARDASSSSASQAAESATQAAGSASDAAQSATAAQSSESAAATSAQNAAASEAAAATSARNAGNSASAAATSETNAANSATAAAGSAGNAATSEQNASASATAAANSVTAAQTAQSAAEDAQGAAETAAASVSSSAAQIAQNTSDISDLNRQLNDVDEIVRPEFIEVTEALYYYPIRVPNGATLVIDSKTGESYSSGWALLFYGEDKTNVLQYIEVGTSQTHKQITITATGVVYARPNVEFSGDALISVLLGDSLIEKVEVNSDNIASNTSAIAENTKEIADIKSGKNNLYDGISLILGRVYQGVYSDAITTVHCTDFLPITPGRTYAVYGAFLDQNYSNYYDKNKAYKGSLPLDGLNRAYPYNDSNNFLLFTAPSDAAYTRINFFNSALIDGTDIRPEWYFRDVTNLVWAKRKILVIGDSISTDVYGNYKKWVTDLQDEGFISNGLVNNNSQHATGFVATYTGDSTTTFINRLTAVGDLTGLDVVITFGGINDWIQSIDFDAFKTAVDTYFAYLIEHATQARIIVFSPLHTALYGTTNSAGKTQKDYDDYIKSVAKDYAFPCLNLTDESGFCPDKSATFSDMWTLLPAGFSDHDGVHPIETWEKNFLAPMIKGFLSNL